MFDKMAFCTKIIGRVHSILCGHKKLMIKMGTANLSVLSKAISKSKLLINGDLLSVSSILIGMVLPKIIFFMVQPVVLLLMATLAASRVPW